MSAVISVGANRSNFVDRSEVALTSGSGLLHPTVVMRMSEQIRVVVNEVMTLPRHRTVLRLNFRSIITHKICLAGKTIKSDHRRRGERSLEENRLVKIAPGTKTPLTVRGRFLRPICCGEIFHTPCGENCGTAMSASVAST